MLAESNTGIDSTVPSRGCKNMITPVNSREESCDTLAGTPIVDWLAASSGNKGSKARFLSLGGVAEWLDIMQKIKALAPGESSSDWDDKPREERKPTKHLQNVNNSESALASDKITEKSVDGKAVGAASLNHREEKHPAPMKKGLKTTDYERNENDAVAAAIRASIPDQTASEDLVAEARRRILSRERAIAREVAMHDFEVRNPPPLKCAAPDCGRTFTRDEHYMAHWAAGEHPVSREPDRFDVRPAPSSKHGAVMIASTKPVLARTVSDEPSFLNSLWEAQTPPAEQGHPELGGKNIALFHLALANGAGEREETGDGDDNDTSNGFSLVSSYITRLWGHGPVHNTLLFWRAVVAWRRHPTTSEAFVRRAITLRRMYVDLSAPQEATLPCETRRDLLRVLETLPEFNSDAVEATEAEGAESDEVSATAVLRGKDGTSVVASRSMAPKTSNGTRAEGVPAAKYATAFSGTAASSYARGSLLRPTSFDQAQWCALLHLTEVVGPGFWRSDFGRRAAVLLSPEHKRKRRNADEIVRQKVCTMLLRL